MPGTRKLGRTTDSRNAMLRAMKKTNPPRHADTNS